MAMCATSSYSAEMAASSVCPVRSKKGVEMVHG